MDDMDETMTTSTTSTPSNHNDTNHPDEGFEEDNLYPDEDSNLPHTPANDHLNAAAPGELSPPRSQPRDPPTSSLLSDNTSEPMANGKASRSSNRVANMLSKVTNGTDSKNAYQNAGDSEQDGANQPGSGWKSKKAQEEVQRAWENIADKDFSLKEYGDVMLLGKAQLESQH